MLESVKTLTLKQYEAALSTIARCVRVCSDEMWIEPIVELTFNQAAFHTLFFGDLYLVANLESMKDTDFHRQHVNDFQDYEEYEDKKPENTYSKKFILDYAQYCREKAITVINSETETSLNDDAPHSWINMSRAEQHIYNIRHLQHHAAQLIMRLRSAGPIDFPWHHSGWKT